MHNLRPGATLHPGANLHPGADLHPLASRSYVKKSCPCVPRYDLKFNTRYIVLWSSALCLNVLDDSNPLLLRFMYVMDTSTTGCAAETFTLHSYKSKKSIVLIKSSISYSYDCISTNDLL